MNHPLPSSTPGATTRNAAMDGLRAFIILLVIAHHALLAYHPYAPPPEAFSGANMIWAVFPVVDEARGQGLDVLILWNDTFLMALFFLLSGLFVWPSLERKGAGRFLRDRFIRLAIPWVVGVLVLVPLAYYPAYILRTDAADVGGFWRAWLALDFWPSGPFWFLWVLFVFGGLAALLHRAAPRAVEKLAALGAWGRGRPFAMGGVFIAAALLAYVPLSYVVNYDSWFTWGPFAVQTGRGLLYATYFLFGIALGARGALGEGIFASDGKLARSWISWQVIAGVVFVLFVAALVTVMTKAGRGESAPLVDLLTRASFVATGATTSIALLASFARRCSRGNALFANLSRNAFGMYVVHYTIVSWTQYAFLNVSMQGHAKAAIVTVAAILLSWAGAAALRRIPAVARVL